LLLAVQLSKSPSAPIGRNSKDHVTFITKCDNN
jgi:hypothetical protein